MNYILGVDVWEGNPNIDEPILKAAGVEYMIVRLNDMNGGHHKDTDFDAQWAQASSFVHWPYFVYNPWVSGLENYTWLANNMPADAHAVSIDIEVRKSGYSPVDYAYQVGDFLSRAAQHWNLDIYSGAGYIDLLSSWPAQYPYWWARWPGVLYPAQRQNWTWNQLKTVLDSLAWNPGTTPGVCHNWQVTGDRLVLPGCGGVCVDINAWHGTIEELRIFAGYTSTLTWSQAIDAWARSQPNPYTGPEPE